ncbi:uncharacterized protein K452DRAFT_309529 [Aplosporella prunicola CBS 121167]|uniref:Cytochrome P450 n=1 Tax=Aplosporella prunicola CBS 121167 TaxID=1176127 RepID=A0A6A6BAQ4_9PEZI|nr:uncharacterized protein K452DRAFT_309529 [Aplosporella prunicola CBS 121167]KAF2141096.1 hypothetical protein K452DRAFT_309529 [Aplosporella prunicola CBS 121167]
MASILLSLLGVIASFLVLKIYAFIKNIRLARATGLPYVLSPWIDVDDITIIVSPLLRKWNRKYLTKGQGWPKAHEEHGEVFLVVAPSGIICQVGNSGLASYVTGHRRQFTKAQKRFKVLEIFGPSLGSTDGDTWRRHQRIVLPVFGDQLNEIAWKEAARQANLLKASWSTHGTQSLDKAFYTLTVNVIAHALYGQQVDWEDDASIPSGHTMNLVGSIMGIINNLLVILVLPRWLLRLSPWQKAYKAVVENEQFMQEFLAADERRIVSGLNSGPKSVLTALAESRITNSKGRFQLGTNIKTEKALTYQEIMGNLFVFLLAGYDITALSLQYAFVVLASQKVIQDRIINEIDGLCREIAQAGQSELNYSQHFPRLRYTLAFMVNLEQFEVLRVFPIANVVSRITEEPQEIQFQPTQTTQQHDEASSPRRHILPAGTTVHINIPGIEHAARYWPQPSILEPRRWLRDNPNEWDPLAMAGDPDSTTAPIPNYAKGTFMGFNEGAHMCPGRKFAQAEFVAVVAELLRCHRVELCDDKESGVLERELRLRNGDSPVLLSPPVELRLKLVPRA